MITPRSHATMVAAADHLFIISVSLRVVNHDIASGARMIVST